MDISNLHVDVTEIVTIPRRYYEKKEPKQDKQSSKDTEQIIDIGFERFLGAILHSGNSMAFRIQNISGLPRLLYLTSIEDSGSNIIENAFLAQFPEFGLRIRREQVTVPEEEEIHVVQVYGVPKQTKEILNGIVQILTKTDGSSLYQVSVEPKSLRGIKGRTGRYIAKKRYESALQKSQTQVAGHSWLGSQDTITRIDVDAQRKSTLHEQTYRRRCADNVLTTRVSLAFWGSHTSEITLRNAVNVFLGAVSEEDRSKQMKVTYLKGQKARAAIHEIYTLGKAGKSIDLSPKEASVFFQIPTVEFGIEQGIPAQFTTSLTVRNESDFQGTESMFTPGYITFGPIYRHGQVDRHQIKQIDVQYLKRHTLIVGMTDTGKSNTKNRIVIDAWRNGIPSLLIEPVKEDARILMGAIPELRVFTLGNETVTPFRQNPFWIEEGVLIQTHVNLLYACFVAGWPLYGMLANHTRRIINNTYSSNGWDVLLNVRGTPITLDLFRDVVNKYCDDVLQYGSELSQDFRGALIHRAEDLCDPSRAAIFNTIADLPTAELFSCPTIIELKHLGDPEFTAFTLSLILVRIYEYFDKLGPSKHLRALLVIDEAHRVLEELPKTLDMSDAAMAKRQVVDQFVNLIAEARSYGLGVVLADQIPTRLAKNALKNCHITIVHKLKSTEDRELMANEIGCNEEQKNHIAVMRVGEAVISEPSSVSPTNVQIFYDPVHYPDMEKTWTDDDLRERMRPFYEKYPEFAKTPDIPVLSRRKSGEESVAFAVQVEDIVHTKTFRGLWAEAILRDQEDLAGRHLEELLAHYAVHLNHIQASPFEVSEQILESASRTYGNPPRQPNPHIIRQYLEKYKSAELQQPRRD